MNVVPPLKMIIAVILGIILINIIGEVLLIGMLLLILRSAI